MTFFIFLSTIVMQCVVFYSDFGDGVVSWMTLAPIASVLALKLYVEFHSSVLKALSFVVTFITLFHIMLSVHAVLPIEGVGGVFVSILVTLIFSFELPYETFKYHKGEKCKTKSVYLML